MSRLGAWNDVPGKPEWFYGVSQRHADESATHHIYHRQGGTGPGVDFEFEFTASPNEDRHEIARRMIAAWEQGL